MGEIQPSTERTETNGIPPEVMCDREGCDHVGVTEIDGERLCRPHEMEINRA